MNLLLVGENELVGDDRACITEPDRLRHVREVLRLGVGDELEVGRIGGLAGRGRIVSLQPHSLEISLCLENEPPPPLPVTLVLALPRPPILRRTLQAVTSLGVKRIVLLDTARVEKSFWQSSTLAPEALRRNCLLGLEQARDTVLPEILVRRRFRPFVEDELPQGIAGGRGLVAHPGSGLPSPRPAAGHTTLLVGPEGGFVPFELERLQAAGARLTGLGERSLRVDTAVVALLARLSA